MTRCFRSCGRCTCARPTPSSSLEVDVPAGGRSGPALRLRDRGDAGRSGAPHPPHPGLPPGRGRGLAGRRGRRAGGRGRRASSSGCRRRPCRTSAPTGSASGHRIASRRRRAGGLEPRAISRRRPAVATMPAQGCERVRACRVAEPFEAGTAAGEAQPSRRPPPARSRTPARPSPAGTPLLANASARSASRSSTARDEIDVAPPAYPARRARARRAPRGNRSGIADRLLPVLAVDGVDEALYEPRALPGRARVRDDSRSRLTGSIEPTLPIGRGGVALPDLAELLGHRREELPGDRRVGLDERPEIPRGHPVADHVADATIGAVRAEPVRSAISPK